VLSGCVPGTVNPINFRSPGQSLSKMFSRAQTSNVTFVPWMGVTMGDVSFEIDTF
jgi:hypothetical protein